MEAATFQPELYTYTEGDDNITVREQVRVFAPVCLLDHKYYLETHPQYFFIIRKDLYCNAPESERVCLYKDGAISPYLTYDSQPFTNWIANELRDGRRIEKIFRDMEAKVDILEPKPEKKIETIINHKIPKQ